MGLQEAVRTCFAKYFDFEGEASRPEFWWFFAFTGVVNFALAVVSNKLSAPEAVGVSVVQGVGGFRVVKGAVAASREPFEQSRNHVGEIGAARSRKDANGKDGRRWHCFDSAVYLN